MCIDVSKVECYVTQQGSVKNPDSPSRVLTEFLVSPGADRPLVRGQDQVKATC